MRSAEQKRNEKIIGINVLVYVVYLIIGLLTKLPLGILLVLGLHFLVCFIAGLITGKKSWYLSALVIFLLGFGTCYFVVMNNLNNH